MAIALIRLVRIACIEALSWATLVTVACQPLQPATPCSEQRPCPPGMACIANRFCAAIVDGGTTEGSATEGGTTEGGTTDGGTTEGGTTEGGTTEGGTTEGGTTEGGTAEVGVGDNRVPDRRSPDRAGLVDARNSDRTGDAGADVCPQTASFSESFDDRITAERNWHIETTAGCSAGFSGGSASVVASGSAASECTFTSTSCFDLTSSDIVFEIDPITDHLPQLRAFIRARAANGNTLEIAFQEDHFLHGLTINQVQIPYDDQALYWRMRGGGNGYVYFHSSTDGVAWDLLGYYQLSWAVDQVHVIFGVSTSAPMARSIGVGTASYNLLP